MVVKGNLGQRRNVIRAGLVVSAGALTLGVTGMVSSGLNLVVNPSEWKGLGGMFIASTAATCWGFVAHARLLRRYGEMESLLRKG